MLTKNLMHCRYFSKIVWFCSMLLVKNRNWTTQKKKKKSYFLSMLFMTLRESVMHSSFLCHQKWSNGLKQKKPWLLPSILCPISWIKLLLQSHKCGAPSENQIHYSSNDLQDKIANKLHHGKMPKRYISIKNFSKFMLQG